MAAPPCFPHSTILTLDCAFIALTFSLIFQKIFLHYWDRFSRMLWSYIWPWICETIIMQFFVWFNLIKSSVWLQVNYALGSLYYLCNSSTKEEILKPEVLDVIKRYAACETVNVSFSNLAKAFLDKHVYENKWH